MTARGTIVVERDAIGTVTAVVSTSGIIPVAKESVSMV